MPHRTLSLPVGELRIFPDPPALSQAAAAEFRQAARSAVTARGQFLAALSGGSTPRAVYSLLAEEPASGRLPWEQVHLFFGDERCVPSDHPESNFRMARESLFSKVPLPARSIHRVRTELDPVSAARDYAQSFAPGPGSPPAFYPRFALV